ncbi:thiamine pyrophosphate-binding protein [Allomesorhizobium alhagi]|nr:thiamine pyrophosphate-binding protein [Mesorhizobium alhagi]
MRKELKNRKQARDPSETILYNCPRGKRDSIGMDEWEFALSVTTKVASAENAPQWGSDLIADTLRTIGFRYISMTPGASFRGLHDSIVNHLRNTDPQMLTCIHEESAVALAHGYAKVTGEPMAVALHANVGLMHATMAIFNAWCDRVPMVLLGATGPMDATRRRPWVDWIHTGRDMGSLIRGYTKWDDQPCSPSAGVESLLRANQIARTAPCGPTYVCLDAGDQESELTGVPDPVELRRFQPPRPGIPSAEIAEEAARRLLDAKRPVILAGRSLRSQAAWDARVRLAESLNARVVTDLRTGACFPTVHPLNPYRPGIYIGQDAIDDIGRADVALSLDWIDLAGTLRQSGATSAHVIHFSPDQYGHNGWSFDHLGVPEVDLFSLTTSDNAVSVLNEAVQSLGMASRSEWRAEEAPPSSPPTGEDMPLSIRQFATTTSSALEEFRPTYIRLPIGWPGECCSFEGPLDYLGYDGGGGIGSGPGMAVGAALGLRGTDRLPVAIIGDGDFLMGATAIWTAVRYRVPLLVIVANNASFFNDEIHQEKVAIERGRPVENRSIGISLDGPVCDVAAIARAQGAEASGPIESASQLEGEVRKGAAHVRSGGVFVIDARVAPNYGKQVLRGLLKP